MKQYGYSRCMDKEEKWYPEEKEDRYFEKDDDYFDKKEKCFDIKEKCFDKEDDYFEEEKCQCKKQRREKECERKERCKVVVEPTVYCKEEKSFRHCVKHIVPVVCKEVENHHFDHEYVIEKKVIKEKNRYDHGRRNEDWCKLAGCGCGREREREYDRKDDCDCE